jgi:large subunit ribosomal protein L23
MKQAFEIILKPIISEQSLREAEAGRYSFIVDKKSSKVAIRKAIEDMFNVSVTRVMTNIVKGNRSKLTKKRKVVSDASYKKARVSLKKGEKLAIFDEHLESAK